MLNCSVSELLIPIHQDTIDLRSNYLNKKNKTPLTTINLTVVSVITNHLWIKLY